MAAPVRDLVEMSKSFGEVDKKCDFLSEEFDPLTALSVKDPSIVPNPEVAAFNNLAEYSNAVKGLTAAQRKKKKALQSEAPGTDQPQRQWTRIIKPELISESGSADVDVAEAVLVKGKGKQKNVKKDVFKGMEALSLHTGPLSTLHTALKDRIQVKVWTRSAKQLRGFSVGFVVAFDKHWNLAMVDVDETYTRPCLPRTSFTKPTHLLEKRTVEGRQIEGRPSSRPSTPSSGNTVTETASANSETKTKDSHSRISDNNSRTQKQSKDNSFVVPGSTGYGEEDCRTLPRFPRGIEIKEKIPGLSGRVFVRHLNQVFIRGDNVAMVQLLR